ncbi:MAG: DUF262 domain-containing protein [Gammaproteobacteria bacterium]|nr:DUF262 domain-containing protein [Gammaproteobacteria bacterium]
MPREDATTSDAITIHELLEGTQTYQMPLFQRQYEWTAFELDRFWTDLTRVLEGESDTAFLGAIVLQLQNRGGSARSTKYVVIDGQQRLTTFFLTICAMAAHAQSCGWTDVAEDLETQYLISRLKREENSPKLVPTPRDNAQFNAIIKNMNHPSPKLLPHLGTDSGRMTNAFEHTAVRLREALTVLGDGNEKEKFEQLKDSFFDKLEVVQIILTKSHDANQVFDRLNTAGRLLRVIDLVRNEVFQSVSDVQEAVHLFDHKWDPFEKALLGSAGDRDISFRQRQEDNFFFPYCLVHDQGAAKNRLFVHLRKYWDELTNNTDGLDKAELIVEDLHLYIEPYLALHSGDKPTNIGKDFWQWVLKIRNIPLPAVTYPFFMQLIRQHIDDHISEDDAVLACRTIESFLVRRAFAGFEPTGLHSVFKQLWGRCKGNVRALSPHLQTSTIQFPGDEDTAKNIAKNNLYSRKICKYVLTEYEWHLQHQTREPAATLPDVTVDHIMPQHRSGDWRQVISAEEHEKLVHVWGNLVPLSKPLNSLKGSKNFAEASSFLVEETQFRSVKEVHGRYDKWEASTIRKRTKDLANWAIGRWPNF